MIADIQKNSVGSVSVSVGPQLVYKNEDLYHIDAENNALIVEGINSGSNLYKGRGAGGSATASAITADLGLAVKTLVQKQKLEFQ